MKEYNKIYSPFVRDEITNKLKKGEWSRPEFEYLKDQLWFGTEKIDGTNIRIMWNGTDVLIGGKTDNAQISVDFLNILQNKFCTLPKKQLFAEKFGTKQVCFYGEGYGAGIQKGGIYRQDKSFILFDVMINGNWLGHGNVKGIAETFEIDLVPIMIEGTLPEIIKYVESSPKSYFGDFVLEGIVARPAFVLLNGFGERLITKIKVKDFT